MEAVFDALCSHLERGHEVLRRLEKRLERDRLTNGTLTEEKEKNLEESKKAYDALLGNVTSLSSSLDRRVDIEHNLFCEHHLHNRKCVIMVTILVW